MGLSGKPGNARKFDICHVGTSGDLPSDIESFGIS